MNLPPRAIQAALALTFAFTAPALLAAHAQTAELG